MKKKLARDINKSNKEINEQVEASAIEISNIGNKLLKNDSLTFDDINQLGQRVAEQQGYDKNQLIICNVTELNKHLLLHKDDDIEQKPIFIICDDGTNNRGIFCIVKLLDKTVCLYKDFLNIQIPEKIKNILEQNFGKNIEFKVHAKTEKTKNQKDNDILSLKTLETMMVYLKPDKKNDFIEGFADPKKTFFGWLKDGVVGLKDELFSLVKEGYYKTVASDIDQLSRDTEFKKAINKLINSIPLIEEVDNFKIYQTLLKEFVEIEESEINTTTDITNKIKELEEARKNAFSKTKELKIETFQNAKGDRQLDIVKQFPTQMEKFTRIFEPLTISKVDEKLDKILEEISIKLDIEYNKLKSFFKVKEEEKQNDNYNTSNIKNIEDVINGLPKPQSKDTNVTNIDNKPFDKLLSEIVVEKSDIIESLREGYGEVKKFHKLWEDKDALAINRWAVSQKGHLSHSEIYQAIAIMDRTNELVTGGHRLRDSQILSVLTFLQQRDKGQLAQIQTGEGKTTIVSILAAIKVLQGKTVDVITSNPVLASDGIKDKKDFYSILNLSATTNNLDENYKSGERECYKADIVYGTIGNFQFDYLKDSFLGLKTRAYRSFESIILDEVDSMIIDNASHIAKLAGALPGMESFKYIYIKIWQKLHKAEEEIIQEFQEKLKEKAQELDSQKLPDDQAQALYKKFEDQLKDSIIQTIKDYIKSSNPTKIDIIPSHIQEYADNSLDRWINSAIDAKFNYHEDEQYIIRINKEGEEVVQPVDYANTGITLKNTIWQYGLHQFLQLKHNLHLTSESLTSCFISNLGYINKYGDKIFGLTGTLGSEAEQELLSSIYNVSYAKIPTYKEKKFIEIDGEVVDDEVFSKQVADGTISEVNNGRSSLIICETIKDAKTIQEVLKRKNEDIIIKTFFDEENAHITEAEIKPGEVVIATNIAGRGTDFKTSAELENNGGLQVCVAFLPCNKRVEEQAFGRTARQGNNGTAKLVIKRSEIEKLGIDSDDFTRIKTLRDLKEKDRIKQIKEVKILELDFQDRLFEHFSTLYQKLKIKDQSEGEYQYALDDLKEFWAFWLEKNKGLALANKSSKAEFEDFKSKACEIIRGVIKFNPYYSIQQAEYFILNEKLDKAEQSLNHAIKISKNPEILHSAYIKLFEIAIEKGGVFMDKCKKAVGDVFVILPIDEPDRAYKEDAKKYLEKAKEAFKKELDYIKSLFGAEEFTSIITSRDTKTNKKDQGYYWFSDDDMHTAGEKILESLVKNINVQFINRLTKDQIENFCKNHQLQDELPIFICFNIGGITNQDSGIHWISMCVVKIQDHIKVFYKDSKSDFANNMEIVKEEFKKYYQNLDFIPHTHAEQNDDSSCGPMTLQNLRIMAQSIQKNGIEKFIENFTSLRFSQQNDVLTLRNEFVDILPNESQKIENLFIKHIVSKQQALSLNMEHADSLIQQIDEHEGGISINGRIVDYFSNLKPQSDTEHKIKSTITNSELSELAAIGTNTTYALREVHDVCPEVATGAQVQIGEGIALLATGFCFPPALPVTSAIGGTMITEGLCDIAIELINKNSDGTFNKEAYIKGKVISYGVSILTMGISAAMQCSKILNTAKKACRWVSDTLRKCPFLESTCEFLATKFNKLGNWFEKIETIAKFNNMSKVEKLKYVDDLNKSKDLKQLQYLGENIKQIQVLSKELQEVGKLTELTHFEQCISTMKQVVMSTTKSVTSRVAENIIMSKVVTPALSSLMLELKPMMKKHVDKSIRENIDQEKLKSSSYEDIQNIIKEIRESIDYETIKDIFKDTILALTKYCSNWRVQLCALAVDQYDSWQKVYNYAKNLCEKINGKLKSTAKSINQNVDELINQLIEQFSEEMYSQFVSTTVKTCKDVYSVGRSAYANYRQEKKEEATCLEINKDFKEGGQAGQEQAKALSDVIKRPIYIYDEEGNRVIIGEQHLVKGAPIEVSYFPPDENNPAGHYVPFSHDKNWSSDNNGTNNCLFDAVGLQIGKDASTLRQSTVKQIKSDPTRYIVHHVTSTNILMKGGAPRYYEMDNSSSEAERILDESQGQSSQAQADRAAMRKDAKPAKGHPRSHATRNSLDTIPEKEDFDSEEKISCAEITTKIKKCTKTAFISKKQQNSVTNEVMKMPEIKDAIDRLNRGSQEEIISIPTSKLDKNKGLQMYKVTKGNIEETLPAQGIKLILGHHEGKQDDPNADPHIKTIYPTAPSDKDSSTGLRGINSTQATNIGWIYSYFAEYTINAIADILELRINKAGVEDIAIAKGYVFGEHYNNLQGVISYLSYSKSKIILVPLNLYNKHAAGIMCIKNQENDLIYYIDPSNENIPSEVKQIFTKNNLQIIQLPTKQQKYANCGSELIENFMLYLTGYRIPENKAVEVHSQLVEKALREKDDLEIYSLFEQSAELLSVDNLSIVQLGELGNIVG
jgi:hypothetical protein